LQGRPPLAHLIGDGRLGHSLTRVHPLGAEIWSPEKVDLGGYDYIEISVISGPKFAGLVSPNAGGIAVDQVLHQFWISLLVPDIFAAELRSRLKSGQILHVFGP